MDSFNQIPQPYTARKIRRWLFWVEYGVFYEDTCIYSTLNWQEVSLVCEQMNVAYRVGWYDGQIELELKYSQKPGE